MKEKLVGGPLPVQVTEKPAIRAIPYSLRSGENVLDLFGGSVSTLIAAEQSGRKALHVLPAPAADRRPERNELLELVWSFDSRPT